MTLLRRPATPDTLTSANTTGRALRARSFDRELVTHIKSLRGYACSLTRDSEKADDLVQETILRAITHHTSFRVGTNQRAWLFRILRNVFLAQKRQENSHNEISLRLQINSLAGSPLSGSQYDHVLLKEVSRKLMELPQLQWRAIYLIGKMGLSYQEAAKVENCAVGTMKSRVCRARMSLYAAFGNLAEETNRANQTKSGISHD